MMTDTDKRFKDLETFTAGRAVFDHLHNIASTHMPGNPATVTVELELGMIFAEAGADAVLHDNAEPSEHFDVAFRLGERIGPAGTVYFIRVRETEAYFVKWGDAPKGDAWHLANMRSITCSILHALFGLGGG